MINLSFYGAAGEVTGSCYLVETPRARVLVDFGLHQGDIDADARNRTIPPLDPERLDAVVLTHGHLDHCGRLPLLLQHGYRGSIYATPQTTELSEVILRDSASIQESDAADENRRRAREGKPPVPPLYAVQEAERTLQRFKDIPYGRTQEIASGISIRFLDAGHILGSASVLLTIRDPESDTGRDKVILFSGDVGVVGAPILRDPQTHDGHVDAVVLESTYGDRDHRPLEQTLDEFVGILTDAKLAGGKVLIPAFAVGRTQDLIYHMGNLLREGRMQPTQVFIDSPMAILASELYAKHHDVHDADAKRLRSQGHAPLDFPGLHFVKASEESRKLNDRDGGIVVIAGSGMCTGGRILHHLRHNLRKPGTHVVIVGYQAEGTLGRQLVDGHKVVRIFREEIPVIAQVHTLGGFSAHAGQTGLMEWFSAAAPSKPRVFLTHGENGPRGILQSKLARAYGVTPELPEWGSAATL
jgi:metallo-beta-lactamase family protein